MPEALAVVFVFITCVTIYIAAKIQSGDPSQQVTVEDLTRHQAWLVKRRAQAIHENWDGQMVAQLSEKLVAIERQLRQQR